MKNTTVVQNAIIAECNSVKRILVEKNVKYGNSAIDPVRIFSSCNPDEQLNVRIDDKLSRVARGKGKDDEDVSLDIIGYLVLKRVYKTLKDSGYLDQEDEQDKFFSEDEIDDLDEEDFDEDDLDEDDLDDEDWDEEDLGEDLDDKEELENVEGDTTYAGFEALRAAVRGSRERVERLSQRDEDSGGEDGRRIGHRGWGLGD